MLTFCHFFAKLKKFKRKGGIMKKDIHPDLHKVKFVCACGNEFEGESTCKGDTVKIEICNKCHPFFSGKTKIVDSTGRVEKFNKKLKK